MDRIIESCKPGKGVLYVNCTSDAGQGCTSCTTYTGRALKYTQLKNPVYVLCTMYTLKVSQHLQTIHSPMRTNCTLYCVQWFAYSLYTTLCTGVCVQAVQRGGTNLNFPNRRRWENISPPGTNSRTM